MGGCHSSFLTSFSRVFCMCTTHTCLARANPVNLPFCAQLRATCVSHVFSMFSSCTRITINLRCPVLLTQMRFLLWRPHVSHIPRHPLGSFLIAGRSHTTYHPRCVSLWSDCTSGASLLFELSQRHNVLNTLTFTSSTLLNCTSS